MRYQTRKTGFNRIGHSALCFPIPLTEQTSLCTYVVKNFGIAKNIIGFVKKDRNFQGDNFWQIVFSKIRIEKLLQKFFAKIQNKF